MAIIIGAMVLTPYLMVPILGFLGFAATGPVAGTWRLFSHNDGTVLSNLFFFPPSRLLCHRILGTFAAWIQSWIGIVAAGGLFAMAQATAMGGRITALIRFICCFVIGLVMLLVVLLVLLVLWVLWSPLGSDLVVSSRSPAPLPGSP